MSINVEWVDASAESPIFFMPGDEVGETTLEGNEHAIAAGGIAIHGSLSDLLNWIDEVRDLIVDRITRLEMAAEAAQEAPDE